MRAIICILIMLFSMSAMAESSTSEAQSQPQQQSTAPNYIFNISYGDAEAAISKALSEKAEPGKVVAATINGKKASPIYSYNKPIAVEVRGLIADSSKKTWSANLLVLEGGAVLSATPLAGRYGLLTEVPVLSKSMRAGDVITVEDIETKTFPQESIHADNISTAAQLLGKSPVRAISPGRPIRSNEISAPTMVKKNSLVQIRYKSKNMEITTTGQVMADGGQGEVIDVKNTNSKKLVRAVVVDAGTVDILAQGVENVK